MRSGYSPAAFSGSLGETPGATISRFHSEEVPVMRKLLACTILLAGLIGLSGMAMAQDLPIPGVEPAKDQPGAHEYPDPKLTYKLVFDLAGGPDTPDKVNPGLRGVAEFINTLAKYNVPASHRIIAVVFHQKSTPAILINASYADIGITAIMPPSGLCRADDEDAGR
jgi:hypothetical protein